jgi:hypothetical protein
MMRSTRAITSAPNYVTPTSDDVAPEGFAVIREVLRSARKIGLGQIATRGRDQICAVRPCGDDRSQDHGAKGAGKARTEESQLGYGRN